MSNARVVATCAPTLCVNATLSADPIATRSRVRTGVHAASEATLKLRKQLQAAKWKAIADKESASQANERAEVAEAHARDAEARVAAIQGEVAAALEEVSETAVSTYKNATASRNMAISALMLLLGVLGLLFAAATSLGVLQVTFTFP